MGTALIAESTDRPGLYVAFNKKIVTEAKSRFPKNVEIRTIHSLAYRDMVAVYGHSSEKLTGKMNAQFVADLLKLGDALIEGTYPIGRTKLGYLIHQTVLNFTHSADAIISHWHVPTIIPLMSATAAQNRFARTAIAEAADTLWAEMMDVRSAVPLGFDGYLKLWALGKPTLATDFILVDEAQDLNPVVLEIIQSQSAQIVYVGDTHQQIYEYLGAVDAMKKAAVEDQCFLSQSFRFGIEIAELANRVLKRLGEKKILRGNLNLEPGVIGPILQPDCILCRTNATTLVEVMECLQAGKKPHLVGGPEDLKRLLKGVVILKAGNRCDVPDFYGFANWSDVVEYSKGEEGEHLLAFVNLVSQHGEMSLLWHLNRCVHQEQADVAISTAHKAKGLQWPKVKLTDDFARTKTKSAEIGAESSPSADVDRSELRLLYVAMTRAQSHLEISERILKYLDL
jgi:hypothetical protein